MLPILPPMEAAAIIARKRAAAKTGLDPSDIGIIFLSPCPSKITFIHDPLGMRESNVDAVLAIKDIYPLLLSHMKEAQKQLDNKVSYTLSGRIGKGWAISGGEAYGIISDHYLAADGIENVIRVLEDLEDEKILPGLQFVELNACSAGCVGGVLTVENPYIAKAKVKQSSKYEPVLRMHCADFQEEPPEIFGWTEPVAYEPVYTLGANIFESMEKILAPSILAADIMRLGEQIEAVKNAGAKYLHIDVMDGMFVPALSYGMCVVESIRKSCDMVLDVHLMIVEPGRHVEAFAKAGADIITIHLEACADAHEVIRQIHSCGCKAGVSIKPGTPIEVLEEYLDEVELILIMSVEPGFGGQKYIPESTERIRQTAELIRKSGREIELEVDGGVGAGNVELVLEAGANVIVAGSAVFKDPAKNAAEMMSILKKWD